MDEAALQPVTQDRIAGLFARHSADGVRLAYLLTGDAELARDVVQEAFIRVIARLAHLRAADSFEGYLRAAIVNGCRAHFRRRKRERESAPPAVQMQDPLAAVDEAVRLRQVLLTLPIRQRTAVVLRHWMDLSDAQAAELMGCARGTVRALATQGIARLRAQMKGQTDE